MVRGFGHFRELNLECKLLYENITKNSSGQLQLDSTFSGMGMKLDHVQQVKIPEMKKLIDKNQADLCLFIKQMRQQKALESQELKEYLTRFTEELFQ